MDRQNAHSHFWEYNLAERRNEVHIVYNMDEYLKYDKSKKQSHTHKKIHIV